ncbi:uncharacterized protein [Drosophila kikkawai]|uniref:Uncharacterized protein n=1 Tax=Drosophila kikkawai TaxID=30033 RepID=A0ABM4GR50_DROKI|nr:uncharacterized protein LOC108077043 [Drosophila kikkawai]
MDDDLDFLINALSVPNTPLTDPYDEGQLLEMRDSFKTLQKLLRRNPTALEDSLRTTPRSKAGGGTARRQEQRALSSMLALVGGDYEHASTAWKSADSGTRTSPIICECGLQDGDLDTRLSETSLSLSDEGDMALVPYNKLHNDRSDSETTLTGMSITSSTISFTFPINLVWDNKEYNKESTDSETTLKPDGQRFVSAEKHRNSKDLRNCSSV